MTDKLEALKAAAVDFSKVGLNPITENYYLCECPKCGWIGSSGDINGGPDDEGCYCHVCQDFTEVDEAVTGAEAFNKLLPYVTALLATLKEKDQRIAELNVKLFDQSILLDAAISRAEASGRREEHLKADVAVMAQRNKELESDVRVADGIIANHQKLNAELQQRLQQPIKLPPLIPEDIFAMTPQRHMVANAHNNAIAACSMGIRDAGFKSECTVWKEAKGE